MIRAIYPGSFDPVTLGHLDIIRRASRTVNELIVGVLNNGGKTPLFTAEERVEMLREVTKDIPNVKVMAFSGLLVDFARHTDSTVVVRGLRAISDFDYELQMAQTNRKMNPHVDTMFLATSLEYAYLSSSTVKEVAFFDGDISEFVPEPVVEKVRERVKERKAK
ncbi:pantetheine-phosphate adenylyltransferase [Clostridiaceae bacterium Marseille-Q4145]|nr:pantetheine-phosphate adenylyltransferase [Clostridiaceae bacterium Marseille-Q4145]